jgi:hypothetical protein
MSRLLWTVLILLASCEPSSPRAPIAVPNPRSQQEFEDRMLSFSLERQTMLACASAEVGLHVKGQNRQATCDSLTQTRAIVDKARTEAAGSDSSRHAFPVYLERADTSDDDEARLETYVGPFVDEASCVASEKLVHESGAATARCIPWPREWVHDGEPVPATEDGAGRKLSTPSPPVDGN